MPGASKAVVFKLLIDAAASLTARGMEMVNRILHGLCAVRLGEEPPHGRIEVEARANLIPHPRPHHLA